MQWTLRYSMGARRAWPVIATLLLCPVAAHAQGVAKIWRCGNQYSDRPCQNGREIAPAAAPSTQARAEADAATQKLAVQVENMAREREKQEALAASRRPAVFAHPSPEAIPQREVTSAEAGSARRPPTKKGRVPKNSATDGAFTAKGQRNR